MTALLSLLRYWRRHPLASRDLSGTIRRFVRWQLGSRLVGAPVAWPWIGSTRLMVETGMTGATMNIYCGLHEFADMAFLLHFLRAEDRFVDVGANIGSYTILASGVVGARSVAVEPIPATFAKLALNVAVNGLQSHVQMENCGVGPCGSGSLNFIADQDTCNRMAPADYSGLTVDVPIRDMDSLLDSFSATMWKIDVEGFEEEVLSGASRTLGDETLLVVEMEGDSRCIRETMRSHGFDLYCYDPFRRHLSKEEQRKEGHNWLWIRDVSAVSGRCQSSAQITVGGTVF